jgi:antitoxin ParD1/3/4
MTGVLVGHHGSDRHGPCRPRNVVLTEQQHESVEALVRRSGRYQNASEVLREGVRLVEDREREEVVKLQAQRAAADQGWADLANERYTDLADDDLDDFIGQLGARAAAWTPSTPGATRS